MYFITTIPLSDVDNFITAKMENIWGVKETDPIIKKLSKDDKIIFICGLNYQGDIRPKGFPFLSDYSKYKIGIEEIWRCNVLQPPVRNNLLEPKYQYTFKFEYIEIISDVQLNALKPEIVEIIRKLYTGRNKYAEITESDFNNIFLHNNIRDTIEL